MVIRLLLAVTGVEPFQLLVSTEDYLHQGTKSSTLKGSDCRLHRSTCARCIALNP